MKSLYVCEKCGKMFEEYDQAWACERSHITLDQVFSWDLPNGSDMQVDFYQDGESLPEYIVMKANVHNEYGDFATTTMPNGHEALRYRAVVYKRVDKVKLPNDMTPDDYTDAMLRRQIADNPPEDENEEEEG